jgi:hypothetical protein
MSEILVAIQGPIINTDTRKTVAKTCFFNNVPYVVLEYTQSIGKHNINNNKTIMSQQRQRTIVDPYGTGPLSLRHRCQWLATQERTTTTTNNNDNNQAIIR